MKSPVIVASLLLAAAIVGSAFLLSSTAANAEANRLNAFFAFLERTSQEKTNSGETRLQNLASGVAQSLSKGFQTGFNKPSDESKAKTDAYLKDIAGLPLSDVQLISDDKTSEKCIGLVTNRTGKPIRDIKLNVIYRNKEGKLIDVGSSFTRIDGTLLPDKQFGFAIDHRFGSSSESEAALAAKRAASVDVSIASFETSL